LSRGQINDTYNQAKGESTGYYNDAQNSYIQGQNAEEDYKNQLSKYASSNPYGEGGQFQTDTNKVIANTNDAMARSEGERLQGQALRTGQNSAGDVAATEEMARQGARDTSSEEAQANNQRIGAGAEYGKGVVQASEFPAQFAAGVAKGMGAEGNAALDTQEKAAAWNDPAADMWNQAAASWGTFGGRKGVSSGR
jgi:hypothetical protein